MPSTRIISFAGSSLALEYAGETPARIIDTLYCHLPTEPIHSPRLTYRLMAGEATPTLRLYRQETLLYQGDAAGTAAELLLGDSCYHLATRSREGLLFHAAGLSWQGQGLILPGLSGAGKTTLTAWLLTKGFDYLTDELVFIPWQTQNIQPLTRPLNLKRPARAALKDQIDFVRHAAHILSSDYADLVPVNLFKPLPAPTEPELRLIIFPYYQSDSPFDLRPLTSAQAGLGLMKNLINARNLPGHGFSEVARLTTQGVLAYQMTYANFAQIERHLDHFIDLLAT